VFAVGDEYYSAVVETNEENRLARCDFCPGCWEPDPQGYFSFWKTRVPEPEPRPSHGPRLIDFERLMQLFERLEDKEDEQNLRFRYVLALVLMRKRRLRLVSPRRLTGRRGEMLTLREVGSDRQCRIANPGLADEEIRSVTDRLREILDMPERWEETEENEAEQEGV